MTPDVPETDAAFAGDGLTDVAAGAAGDPAQATTIATTRANTSGGRSRTFNSRKM
ncbi:MAG: hypothetical protein HY678_00860 [Chloroflexi bacterium]|nr:hypothetical protein [Chloroflexota bacterium]